MIITIKIPPRISCFMICLISTFLPCCSGGSKSGTSSPPVTYGSLAVKVITATADRNSQRLATVRIGDRAVTANSNDDLIMDNVQTGNCPISVTIPGYTTYTGNVNITKDNATKLTLTLTQSNTPLSYDLVVIGAGTGGTSAAIQAARMGLKVAIIEETDWIGGQMTAAAVTSLDEGPVPVTRSGIYKEFVDNVKNHYTAQGKSTGTAYFVSTSTAFEPYVGQKILYSMMAKTTSTSRSPDLFLRSKVTGAILKENTVNGVILNDGSQLASKIVIDATEHGDFIPLTPARYRVGNSTSDNINLDANLNPITYTAVLRKYSTAMDNWLFISAAPPGYKDRRSMFLSWITNDGPAGNEWYTMGLNDYTKPFSFTFQNAWRGMPDTQNPQNYNAGVEQFKYITKTGLNAFQNDYPVTSRYLEDRTYRQQVDCNAKLRTLQILYYFQNELGHRDWSVATDEGFATNYNQTTNLCPTHPTELQRIETNLPIMPYVRESRRIIGVGTMTARDIKRDGIKSLKNMASALAVGDYPIDLHGGKDIADLDCGDILDELPNTTWGKSGGTFQIPFEVFVPESVDGLLVAEKNFSVSRLVSGAIRLQPITMMTGQAAGALAAVSVQQGLQPRYVKPIDVQIKLLEAGCVITQYDPKDVPVSHLYWKDIQLALTYSLMDMSESFLPDNTINLSDLANIIKNTGFNLPLGARIPATPATRQDVVQLLMQAIGPISSADHVSQVFNDIPPQHQAFDAVYYINRTGAIPAEMITNGYFSPEKKVTRSEVAAMVVRTLIAIKSSLFFEVSSSLSQIDSSAPIGSVAISNKATVTSSKYVQLLLNTTDQDNVVSMQFSKDGASWSPWEPYKNQRTIELSPEDGLKTVYVRFKDSTNNISKIHTASITLDTTPPIGSLYINNGAETTTSTSVALSLSANDANGVVSMQFSKDGTTWYQWEPFAATRSANLPPGPGVKTLYVRFKDSIGNISHTFSRSITLTS